NLEQRALARTITANDPQYLSATYFKRHVLEGPNHIATTGRVRRPTAQNRPRPPCWGRHPLGQGVAEGPVSLPSRRDAEPLAKTAYLDYGIAHVVSCGIGKSRSLGSTGSAPSEITRRLTVCDGMAHCGALGQL